MTKILKQIYRIWIKFGLLLSWFMTRFILSLLFYLVLTPLSLIARLAGKQLLDIKCNKGQKSYWNYRDKKRIHRAAYEKQF